MQAPTIDISGKWLALRTQDCTLWWRATLIPLDHYGPTYFVRCVHAMERKGGLRMIRKRKQIYRANNMPSVL